MALRKGILQLLR